MRSDTVVCNIPPLILLNLPTYVENLRGISRQKLGGSIGGKEYILPETFSFHTGGAI